jgi:hypothetical protein
MDRIEWMEMMGVRVELVGTDGYKCVEWSMRKVLDELIGYREKMEIKNDF